MLYYLLVQARSHFSILGINVKVVRASGSVWQVAPADGCFNRNNLELTVAVEQGDNQAIILFGTSYVVFLQGW